MAGSHINTKTDDEGTHPFSRMSTSNDQNHADTGNNTPSKSVQGFDFELNSVKSPNRINVETEIRIESEPR